MPTDFSEYFKRKNVQCLIDYIAYKYANKKIMLYGADDFASELLDKYDFSKLHIIGVADEFFESNYEGDFFGFTKYSQYDLLENDFDVLLLLVYEDKSVKSLLNKIFEGEERNFETKTLIKKNILDKVIDIFDKKKKA